MDTFSDVGVPADWECLHILTHISANYLSWMLAWCHVAMKRSDLPLKGFYLSRLELSCLGIDRAELLSLEIANVRNNALVAGTDYYEYEDDQGKEEISRPGEMVMGTYVLGIHFKPDIDAFPYELIFVALRRICKRLKVPYEEYLPIHFGKPCEDMQVIFIAVLNHECDSNEVAQNIRDLRIRLDERINNRVKSIQPASSPLSEDCEFATGEMLDELIKLFRPPQLHELKPEDPFLHCGVNHVGMAKLARCSKSTLFRRDRDRETSQGNRWVPPRKISGNCVMYAVYENVGTIQIETPHHRDIARDHLLRDEINSIKHSRNN